jgi:hypothetical protein
LQRVNSCRYTSGTNVWAFDVDVAVLRVPPLEELSQQLSPAGLSTPGGVSYLVTWIILAVINLVC